MSTFRLCPHLHRSGCERQRPDQRSPHLRHRRCHLAILKDEVDLASHNFKRWLVMVIVWCASLILQTWIELRDHDIVQIVFDRFCSGLKESLTSVGWPFIDSGTYLWNAYKFWATINHHGPQTNSQTRGNFSRRGIQSVDASDRLSLYYISWKLPLNAVTIHFQVHPFPISHTLPHRGHLPQVSTRTQGDWGQAGAHACGYPGHTTKLAADHTMITSFWHGEKLRPIVLHTTCSVHFLALPKYPCTWFCGR